MPDMMFPIRGASIPPLIGREKIMGKLVGDLSKKTPSNLSIIGPRDSGKTVIMAELARRMAADGSRFVIQLHWQLSHQTPQSDQEFIDCLCEHLIAALRPKGHVEEADYLVDKKVPFLIETMKALSKKQVAILMLWDGFDKPLQQGRLSGHLWDQIRDLFYQTQHRVVTATRKPLRELISRDDVDVSPLWNIFDPNPIRLGPFEDQDIDSLVTKMTGYSLDTRSRSELKAWSGGHPILTLLVLNSIAEAISPGPVSNDEVARCAEGVLDAAEHVVEQIWADVSQAHDLFLHIIHAGGVPLSETNLDHRRLLVNHGLSTEDKNRLRANCRFAERFANARQGDHGSLGRLFGSESDYDKNIKGVLLRRCQQITNPDRRLEQHVRQAIDCLPAFLENSLSQLTGIEERALAIIWEREADGNVLPGSVTGDWVVGEKNDEGFLPHYRGRDFAIPLDRTKQLQFLERLTGSRARYKNLSRMTSKSTYSLINAIHTFRNRSEHADGESFNIGVVSAILLTCVELLRELARSAPNGRS